MIDLTRRPCDCDAFGVKHVFTDGVCDPDYDGPMKPSPLSASEPEDPRIYRFDLMRIKAEFE